MTLCNVCKKSIADDADYYCGQPLVHQPDREEYLSELTRLTNDFATEVKNLHVYYSASSASFNQAPRTEGEQK